MTSSGQPPPGDTSRRLTTRRSRDLTAATLILVGTAGLVTIAFLLHPLAGAALAATAAVAAGAALGME